MWHKFKSVNVRGRLPEIDIEDFSMWCQPFGIYDGFDADYRMVPMVGVLPSGKIMDDMTSPECEPYFLIVSCYGDIVTDGEKFACIYNEDENNHYHYYGYKCRLMKKFKKHEKHFLNFTTRDARIIKALIKAYVEGSQCGINSKK